MGEQGSTGKRDQAIEALRILAAFAIVAFHAQVDGYFWFLSGLAVFVFLAAYFAVRRPPTLAGMTRRLLLPFAFFYGVYAAANWALGRPMFPQDHAMTMIFAGPSWHLWFLPFILLVILLAKGIARFDRSPEFGELVTALGIFCWVVLFITYAQIWQFPIPVPQGLRMVPVAILAIAAGLLSIRGRSLQYVPVIVGLIACFVAPIAGYSLAIVIALSGIAAAWFATRFWAANFRVQPIADCMFGVYLTHIITLAIAARLVGRENWAQVILAFMLSLAGVYLARRFVPVTRHVLG